MFNKQQITLLMAFCMERSIDGQECIQLIVDMGMPASELIPLMEEIVSDINKAESIKKPTFPPLKLV